MLNNSNIRFFDSCKKIVIEYTTKNLDSAIIESLLSSKNTKVDFEFDKDKLHLVNQACPFQIALLYNIDSLDQRVGWLLKKMCLTDENMGFIITPMIRWYRHRVIELYHSIQGNLYKAYFDLSKLNKGLISLVIEYNLNSK